MVIDTSTLYKTRAAYESAMAFYDSQLARLTTLYETQYVQTRHGMTHVLTAGDPALPSLVLWHGMNANLTSWVLQIDAFASRFRVIAPDAPGHSGKSDPRRLGRKSLSYGEWAEDVLDVLKIERAHMVGISGGGWQVIKLANVASERIQTATLISSAGFLPVTPKLIIRMLPTILFSKPETASRRFLKMMSPPDYTFSETDVATFMHIFQFKSERSIPVVSDNEVKNLTAPTQLLMGQYEVTYNAQKVIERAKRLLPNLRRAEIVPGVGHGMTTEMPNDVNERVLRFIDET